jgi:hypothetical protein
VFRDIQVFQICTVVAAMSVVLLIHFNTIHNETGIYISNFFTVAGVANMQNCLFILIEMRAPPEKLGSIMALVMTLSFSSLFMTPFLDILEPPMP